METTRNKLPMHIESFFQNLRAYIGVPLYYYGSVQRPDFLPSKSDIDVDIFSNNIKSMVTKLHHYLNRPLSKFHKTVMYMDKRVITGIKVFYKNIDNVGADEDDNDDKLDKSRQSFSAEFSIFNLNDKDSILKHHIRKFDLPYHITLMLMGIKLFYYQFGILNKKQYKSFKNIILSTFIGIDPIPFVTIKQLK